MKYFLDGDSIQSASPTTVRTQARQLTTVADRMEMISGMLQKVSTRGSWESPSGDAFAEKVGSTPGDLTTIANRLRSSAEIIRPYADLLAASQRALTDIDDRAHRAEQTMNDKDKELEDLPPDDPDRARVQREREAAAARLSSAEEAFEEEKREARRDEGDMAAKLSDLCARDADPRAYDFFESLTTFGEGASNAGILARPIALAGVTKPAGMLGKRVFYDEGSYGDVAKASGGYALDTVSFGAGRVVRAAKRRFAEKQVNRVDDLDSTPVRIRDNPIITAAPTKPPTRRAAVAQKTGDILRDKAGVNDVKRAFDDWEAVAGEGRVAKVAVTVRMSAKQGSRARTTTVRSADRVETYVGTDGSRAREREQQRRRKVAREMTEKPADAPLPTPSGPSVR